MDTPRQGLPLFTAISTFIGILVVIQLWLLSAAVEAMLGAHTSILIPAAIASTVLFFINGGLLLHASNFDNRVRQRGTHD